MNIDLKTLPRGLLIIGAVFAMDVGVYLFGIDQLQGQIDQINAQSSAVNQEVGRLRTEDDLMQQDLGSKEKLVADYRNLIALGFTEKQDRLGAVDKLDQMRRRFRLSEMHYKLDPEVVTPAPRIEGAEPFDVVRTTAEISVDAVSDRQAMQFWDEVLSTIPARYRLKSAELTRTNDVTPDNLEKLRSGSPMPFVHSTLAFEWLTLRSTPGGGAAPP